MRIVLILVAAIAATAALPAVAHARNPFPAPTVQQVFIASQTVTAEQALITQIARFDGRLPGIRRRRQDPQGHRRPGQYFYVTIPTSRT